MPTIKDYQANNYAFCFKNKEHYQYFNISRQSASRELNELAKQNILIMEKDKKQTFLQLIQKIGVKNI